MNWVLLAGMVCLAIGIIKKLGFLLGGAILIVVAIFVEMW